MRNEKIGLIMKVSNQILAVSRSFLLMLMSSPRMSGPRVIRDNQTYVIHARAI